MPRFSPETVAVLKAAIRARAGEGYRLREGEAAGLAARTGLSQAQIRHWVSDMHRYYATDQDMERFLGGDGKVRFLNRCQDAMVKMLALANSYENATFDSF